MPTAEQIARFSAATSEERFAWWAGMLQMIYDATDEATHESWRTMRRERK